MSTRLYFRSRARTAATVSVIVTALCTNGLLAGVASAQGASAPPPVDLSRDALRAALAPQRYALSPRAPEWRVVPQDGLHVDTRSGGYVMTTLLATSSGLMLVPAGVFLSEANQPGDRCDTVDMPSCSSLRTGARAMFLTSAALAVLAILKRPRAHGDRTLVGATGLPQSRTVIANRSGHALEVTFEGPADRKVVIQPKSSQVIELQPGQYRESVRVVGRDALPFLSLQTYEAGVAYKEGYYVRK